MTQSPRTPNEYRRPNRLLAILRSGAFYWSVFGAVVAVVLLLITQLR